MDQMVTKSFTGLSFAPGVDPVQSSYTPEMTGAWWDFGKTPDAQEAEEKPKKNDLNMQDQLNISNREFLFFLVLVGVGIWAYKKL